MVLLEASSAAEIIQLISLIITAIVIPILSFALAIAVRHGWLNKKVADTIKEDLDGFKNLTAATSKAIENQKKKNPEIGKELTNDVVAAVADKTKLDAFLKEINLNK